LRFRGTEELLIFLGRCFELAAQRDCRPHDCDGDCT
jgi:hypothetical protein